jgi:hypothetical protein
MSVPNKPSTRIARLDQILAQSPPHPASRSADVDPNQVHLSSVPLDRIHALTVELEQRSTVAPDDLDALTMRLLLNDYKAAVAHLRAVANSIDARLYATSNELHDIRKVLRREQEMTAKHAARGRDASG